MKSLETYSVYQKATVDEGVVKWRFAIAHGIEEIATYDSLPALTEAHNLTQVPNKGIPMNLFFGYTRDTWFFAEPPDDTNRRMPLTPSQYTVLEQLINSTG